MNELGWRGVRLARRVISRGLVRPVMTAWDTALIIEQLERMPELGEGVVINGPLKLGNPCETRFGDGVSINPGFISRGSGRLTIGSHVHFGNDVLVLTDNHDYASAEALPYGKGRIRKDVVIGDAVWIGDRAIIAPGAAVGEGAVVAAGALVTKAVPPGAVVGGVPAKELKRRDMDSFAELKRSQTYLGWPRSSDVINGKKMEIRRQVGGGADR